MAADNQISYAAARSKLAEILEKILKAELLRLGWSLEKTHDLDRLNDLLAERKSDLLPSVEPLCDALYFGQEHELTQACGPADSGVWFCV
jgi:HEPN domain-containing protein